MQIDEKRISKYVKTQNRKNGKEPCTYIKYVRGDVGYDILGKLRQLGVKGEQINRLVEVALTEYLGKK